MVRKLRILQVHHALYVTRLLTQGFRQLGHKADNVYFDFGGKSADLTWGCDFNLSGRPRALPQHAAFLLYAIANYDVFHFWQKPYLIPACYSAFARHLPFDLALLHRLGKKIVFQSDGCYPMIRPSVWKTMIDPQICHTCQVTQGDTYGFCSNANTIKMNAAMERYADMRFGIGVNLDFEASASFAFWPVDLERWNPQLTIPREHLYPRQRNDALLVYHGVGSHVIGNRGNIKGTDWIRQTVQELQDEGYNLELMHVEGRSNSEIRFYQAQSDIVVDQLLLGGGGANARECLALGKPVLTRMHPQQEASFQAAAAPFEPPPFVPTDRHTLKTNLIRLIENPKLRAEIGEKSATFAREVLSPVATARRYVQHYETLW